MAMQFPPRLRQDYQVLGYRYVEITDQTKEKDVKAADAHNFKMHKTSVAHQRQLNLHSTAGPPDQAMPPPPAPTNVERYTIYRRNNKQQPAAALAIAVYNLAQHGKVPFVDYEPASATSTWEAHRLRSTYNTSQGSPCTMRAQLPSKSRQRSSSMGETSSRPIEIIFSRQTTAQCGSGPSGLGSSLPAYSDTPPAWAARPAPAYAPAYPPAGHSPAWPSADA